jgi:hypothetical protein
MCANIFPKPPRFLCKILRQSGLSLVQHRTEFERSIENMPVISMFYGIIIRMYFLNNQHHGVPHIHARYAEAEASMCIDDGEILAGELPRKQLRLVQAWIELHRDELMADWELAMAGENPYKIDPL